MPHYAVQRGRHCGVFETWDECQASVTGFKGAVFKKFPTYAEALEFVKNKDNTPPPAAYIHTANTYAPLPPIQPAPPGYTHTANTYAPLRPAPSPIQPAPLAAQSVVAAPFMPVRPRWPTPPSAFAAAPVPAAPVPAAPVPAAPVPVSVRAAPVSAAPVSAAPVSARSAALSVLAAYESASRPSPAIQTASEALASAYASHAAAIAAIRATVAARAAPAPAAAPRPVSVETGDARGAKRTLIEDDNSNDASAIPYTVPPPPTPERNVRLRQEPTVIWTDGSCLGNGQVGSRAGIGVYFGVNHPLNLAARLEGEKQTNQRAELTAAIYAITIADREKLGPINIHTDSKYLVDAMQSWIVKWKRTNWSQAISNRDLMMQLDGLITARPDPVTFTHVPAHVGIEGNTQADLLAKHGSSMPQLTPNLRPLSSTR